MVSQYTYRPLLNAKQSTDSPTSSSLDQWKSLPKIAHLHQLHYETPPVKATVLDRDEQSERITTHYLAPLSITDLMTPAVTRTVELSQPSAIFKGQRNLKLNITKRINSSIIIFVA